MLSPSFVSVKWKQPATLSISLLLRLAISAKRQPVRARSQTPAIAFEFSHRWDANSSARPRFRYCPGVKTTRRLPSANRTTPRTGLSVRIPSDIAKVRIPPRRPTVRVAVPGPPSTMARPRFLVLTSALVLPVATSRINRLMSAGTRSATRRVPRRGFICRSISPSIRCKRAGLLRALALPKN